MQNPAQLWTGAISNVFSIYVQFNGINDILIFNFHSNVKNTHKKQTSKSNLTF